MRLFATCSILVTWLFKSIPLSPYFTCWVGQDHINCSHRPQNSIPTWRARPEVCPVLLSHWFWKHPGMIQLNFSRLESLPPLFEVLMSIVLFNLKCDWKNSKHFDDITSPMGIVNVLLLSPRAVKQHVWWKIQLQCTPIKMVKKNQADLEEDVWFLSHWINFERQLIKY